MHANGGLAVSKFTPALTLWQDVTAPDRPLVVVLRTLVAIALLTALLALSVAFQHAPITRGISHAAAGAHPALAVGPNAWCPGVPGPC